MKKIIILTVLLSLTACQQAPKVITEPVTKNQEKPSQLPLIEEQKVESVEITPMAKLPHEHDDVWQRIRSQLSIEVPDNKAVAKWRKYYLSHPNFMVTISKRAEPFLYYIVEEIEKRNMPVELALLPIVESSYLPYGLSNKSAAGLWQFMPVSAKRFNIEQNWWYDGRRDIVESTRGALDYFQFFHRTLDEDWLNAIAAFNSGEGRVGRAMAKNKRANLPSDFWSLKLPAETSEFVPKLLAIADILKRADELNYTFAPIKNSPAVAVIKVEGQLDISLAAQWANIDTSEIFKLNPGLNRWATAPDSSYQLMLPVSAADSFQAKLTSTNKKEWLRWHSYTVKSGDSLGKISQQYGIDILAIKKHNNLSSDIIRIGKKLIVPFNHSDMDPLGLAKFSRTKITHTVKSGDNLWDISRKYKVSVRDIVRWNKLSSNSLLQPRQQLAILL
ncbi:LysM peptidoglycan-binding domain-containing protein [Colwellia piezophila]|uniref:LysM peptidoglycan-binding domain-containing protein n=1 Tax=Colwellia piezophila TaxID=211668 RepID=UPI000371AFF5|nr:LysM peptidoglycan-binding domain-containing protein [Colwellia piezophila]